MKLSRRKLFQAAFSASQLALLSKFAPRAAFAQTSSAFPTKLLAIHLWGGLHWESFFAPFTRAGVAKLLPPPQGGNHPWGYSADQIENLDRSPIDLDAPGFRRKWQVPIYWNWASPSDTTGTVPNSGGTQIFRPYGYVWADPMYRLYNRSAVLIGADQGTASHQSGVVASMCGVAGANFRAPAISAVVAAAMAGRFPDRPIPNVSINGESPTSLNLPSLAAPMRVTNDASVAPTLSDSRDSAWQGLRTRTDRPDVAFDGTAGTGTVPLTATDALVLAATRSRRGRSSQGTDAVLEQLYDTYKGASRTVARDLLNTLSMVQGFEHIPAMDPAYGIGGVACIGSADTCGNYSATADFNFALKLLKSNLVTSVSIRATSIAQFAFDTHFAGGPQQHANHLRIALEAVGRTLVEMSVTPGVNPGKSLLDETLVYIYSDFGRTFPLNGGSDHHPATCAVLAGGTILGNQMVGGYDETMSGSPMGVPVDVIEETGSKVARTVHSQDIAATVLGSFGLKPGTDFFIPGGYGIFDGVIG